MKNIFTFNKDSDNLDVEEYITRELEKSNEAEFDKLEEEEEGRSKLFKLPVGYQFFPTDQVLMYFLMKNI